jgi:cytoplasmic polyadenylation element-binding protein
VIPWMINEGNFVKHPTMRLDPQKTVFVGALHGMLNAEGLAKIMNDLFDNVIYAGKSIFCIICNFVRLAIYFLYF